MKGGARRPSDATDVPIDETGELVVSDYTYRTFNLDPSNHERELADALFAIMGRSTHDLAALVAELNRTGPAPQGGGTWSTDSFKAEMKRLGTWTNSIGASVGTHGVPGFSRRAHGQ